MIGRRYSALVIAVASSAIMGCGGGDAAESPDTAAAAARDTGAAAAATADGAMLDPNTATREQLVSLPGMVAAATDTLIAGRPYGTMTDVNRVLAPQLDSAQRRMLYSRLWKPIDINTASDAEILLIPGVGSRMLHEFKEYRPYTSIAEFRREIGKYVDDEEVARLEKYVSIR